MKRQFKKNDEVLVIAGKHKGQTGKVLSVNWAKSLVTVDKINMVKKHNKPTQTNPDGGITEFEAPIHVSNVKLAPKGKKEAKKEAPKKAAAKPAKKEEGKGE